MHPNSIPILRWLAALACCGLVLGLGSPASAEFEHNETLDAGTLVLRNLIGRIEVEGHGGSDFEVTIHVQGEDASPERVRIETDPDRNAEIEVRFPLDESMRYVYPPMRGGNSSFTVDEGGSWLSRLFGGGTVKVSGSGRGLEIWADVVVRVPSGGKLVVDHRVGEITAGDVAGDLDLSVSTGNVVVEDATGNISIDTGSGNVQAGDVRGDLHVDTGSGNVIIGDARGKSVHVDTGSGHVELDDVDSEVISIDTGSGGVQAGDVRADEVTIDTGSGSVSLAFERMGAGRFEIDTGSGSVSLRLPADASAEIRADTGSGGIVLDLSGEYRIRREEEDEVELVVGGGEARVVLDTGSGSIHISQ